MPSERELKDLKFIALCERGESHAQAFRLTFPERTYRTKSTFDGAVRDQWERVRARVRLPDKTKDKPKDRPEDRPKVMNPEQQKEFLTQLAYELKWEKPGVAIDAVVALSKLTASDTLARKEVEKKLSKPEKSFTPRHLLRQESDERVKKVLERAGRETDER